MKQTITKKSLSLTSRTLMVLMVTLGLLSEQHSWGQAFTITYTGLTGNTAAAGVPTGITNTTPYNGVTASCVTSSNGPNTSYATTITAAAGFNFTVTSVSGTAYASSAGSKLFSFRIHSNNGNFADATSAVTTIGSSSSCGGNAALTPLTGSFTVTSGTSCTITVLRTGTGGGYSWTRSLVISGTVSAASTPPTVTTNAAPTGITSTAATFGGNVTATGGAAITGNGTVYSVTSTNATPAIGGSGVTQLATVSPGAGTGAFSRATTAALAVNTQYSYRAYATNASGTSYGGTTGTTFYTLANVPNAPTVDGATLTTLDVSIGTSNGNPATTTYAIQEAGGQYVQADGTLGAAAVYQTAAAWGTKTVTGLNSSATYTFRAIARNGALVVTAAGAPASGTTLTPTFPIAALAASPALSETSLDGGQITISLLNVTFNTIGGLDGSSFVLNNAPPSVYILDVTATSATEATVTLGYDGEDFDANINNFSIIIPGAELSSAEDLTSSTLPVTALVETITLTGTVGSVGDVCIDNTSPVFSYTMSGTGLKDNITITPPADFEVSLSNSPFVAATEPVILSVDVNGNVASTTVYVRFHPSATGATGDLSIIHSSFGSDDKNVAVSGTGIYSAPTVISPASTSITISDASLSGNISFGGCAEVTERGIYWSTINGFADGDGTRVSETGTFTTGVFAQNVPGLPSNTTIYFKAFASNSIGTAYTSQASFNTLKTEPSENATNFACGVTTVNSIPLTWTDAAGDVLPTGYLIKWSATSFASITDPVDGNSNNGANAVTINQGIQVANIPGLLSNTAYYFKIYAYSNSGTAIDYKTDGTIQQTSCTTLVAACNTSSATVNWNFTAGTATANTVPSNLTVGDLLQGNNNGTTALVTSVSVSSGYAGASGTFNAGAAARTGALNTGAGGSAYFEFTLTPATGYNVTLTGISFGSRSTSTGTQAYSIRSSLNNYGSTIVTGALSNGSTWQLISNTGLNIAGATSAPVTFRIYGHNGTGSPASGTANWRIDDIVLNVTVSNAPSAATVGATQNVCGSLTSTSLGGNTPLVGTGTWSQVSGPGNTTFSSPNSGSSTATADAAGTYIYKWSISSGCATVNAANITVNYLVPPTASIAGNNGPICAGSRASFTLTGTDGALVNYTINGVPGSVALTGGIGTIDVLNASSPQILNLVSVSMNSCSQNISGTSVMEFIKTWTGGSGNWNEPANWCDNVVPVSTDKIIINSGNPQLNVDFSVAGTLTINGTGSLTVNPGKTLDIAGSGIADFADKQVTFQSDATGTASLGQVNGTLNGATNVTVERYIPDNGFRSWRLLSVPTYGSGQTIRQAWQEGDANPLPSQNNLPGYGTQISGTGTVAAAQAAGFDNTATSASLLSWTGSAWTGVPGTNVPIANKQSYFLFLRGERSKGVTGLNDNSSATTLRTNGTIYTSDQLMDVEASSFLLVPNLYPSAISFTGLTRTGGVNNLFYVWDSKKLNGSSLGTYQTFSNTNSFNCMISGGSYTLGQPNTIIESGQSFFVTSSAAGTITLKESAKVSEGGSLGFRPAPSAIKSKIDTRLYNAAAEMLDANTVVFDAAYDKAINKEDAPKLGNPGANFAIETGSKLLAIEGTAPVEDKDIIQFRMWNVQQGSYKLEFAVNNLVAEGLTAILEDNYLQTSTAVNLSGNTSVNFTVDQHAASASANRFRIVFSKTKLTTGDSKQGYTIAPNPVENGMINLQFKNQPAGRYAITLVSNSGQTILEKATNYAGNGNVVLGLPAGIANGLYKIIIVSPEKRKTTQTVLINAK